MQNSNIQIELLNFAQKNMFTQGQLLFALAFFVAFIIIMIVSYRKDIKLHKLHYRGSIWILVGFILFILSLFLIKTILKSQ